MQKAFSGPLELRRRTGSLDAKDDRDDGSRDCSTSAFRTPPALHRFPGNMDEDGCATCAPRSPTTTTETPRASGPEPPTRTTSTSGSSRAAGDRGDEGRVRSCRCWASGTGSSPPAGTRSVPKTPTLGDVDSAEALAEYQAGKREHKAAARGAAAEKGLSVMNTVGRPRGRAPRSPVCSWRLSPFPAGPTDAPVRGPVTTSRCSICRCSSGGFVVWGRPTGCRSTNWGNDHLEHRVARVHGDHDPRGADVPAGRRKACRGRCGRARTGVGNPVPATADDAPTATRHSRRVGASTVGPPGTPGVPNGDRTAHLERRPFQLARGSPHMERPAPHPAVAAASWNAGRSTTRGVWCSRSARAMALSPAASGSPVSSSVLRPERMNGQPAATSAMWVVEPVLVSVDEGELLDARGRRPRSRRVCVDGAPGAVVRARVGHDTRRRGGSAWGRCRRSPACRRGPEARTASRPPSRTGSCCRTSSGW